MHLDLKEFIEDTADYSGNQLTGVPESQFNWIGFNCKKWL
jgi:hypothetical protein